MSIAQLIRSFSASQVNPYLTPIQTYSNPNAYGTSANDSFGMAVAISGNLAVIEAYLEDYLGSDSGSVYVYQIP